jgi:hypothetical protein
MPQDETPRQPQALQADGRVELQPHQDASHGAYPEQVFAGESGDPIWEQPGSRRQQAEQGHAAQQRIPRVTPEEKIPPGRIIDLVQAQQARHPRK